MEQWKDIEGYDGDYQVSSYGNVRTFKQGARGTLLKLIDSKESYQKVNLYKNGKMTTYFVHILVGCAFIPNPNNYPCLNHKDENGHNNHVENLEWCTYQYNNTYGTRLQKAANKKSRPVFCVENKTTYKNSVEAGAALGILPRLIRGVCNGEHKTTHGFHFQYTEKEPD